MSDTSKDCALVGATQILASSRPSPIRVEGLQLYNRMSLLSHRYPLPHLLHLRSYQGLMAGVFESTASTGILLDFDTT